jgi:hypothetical protein
MSIIIKHLEGPLAGLEQTFDDRVEVILFGRDYESAQVVFPPEYVVVGRQHFQLRRTRSGEYCVELLGERYVEIDGVPAGNGAVVSSGSKFKLGRADGPTFTVEVTRLQSDFPMKDCAPMASDRRSWGIGQAIESIASGAAGLAVGTVVVAGRAVVGTAKVIGAGAAGAAKAVSHIKDLAVEALRGDDRATEPGPAEKPTNARSTRQNRDNSILASRRAETEASPVRKTGKAESTADLVDVSVFGPTAIKAGGEGLVQVFLHHLTQREIAKALAQEVDPDATRRGVQTLAAEIVKGQHVQIMLEGRRSQCRSGNADARLAERALRLPVHIDRA